MWLESIKSATFWDQFKFWGRRAPIVVNPTAPGQSGPTQGVVAVASGEGESTGRQNMSSGDPAGIVTDKRLDGYIKAPPGTDETYRLMDHDPTIALAKSTVNTAILAGTRTFEAKDETVPREMVDFIEGMLKEQIEMILESCLDTGLSMGRAAFEKVWKTDDQGHKQLRKLKSLSTENTTVLVWPSGIFYGLRNRPFGKVQVDLLPSKCFLYTYNGKEGNFYGRSRHENVREEWWENIQTRNKQMQYETKLSRIVVQVHYPRGTTILNDVETDNYIVAKQIAEAVAQGHPVALQNLYAAIDPKTPMDHQIAASLAGASQWKIDFMDTGTSDHIGSFLKHREMMDSLKMRGWLRPERSAIEGHHGTKAEAAAHGDVAVLDSDLVHIGWCRAFSWYVIDDVLVQNYGEWARGLVYLKATPLSESQQQADTLVAEAVFTNPSLLEEFVAQYDIDSSLERQGYTLRENATGFATYVPDLTTPGVVQPTQSGINGAANGSATKVLGAGANGKSAVPGIKVQSVPKVQLSRHREERVKRIRTLFQSAHRG